MWCMSVVSIPMQLMPRGPRAVHLSSALVAQALCHADHGGAAGVTGGEARAGQDVGGDEGANGFGVTSTPVVLMGPDGGELPCGLRVGPARGAGEDHAV